MRISDWSSDVCFSDLVQHLSMIDYIAVSGTKEGRVIEYVDHLHEHFVDPCVIRDAAYMPPSRAGFSIEMKPESIGRASCRESVCQYVSISVVAVSLKKNIKVDDKKDT